MFPRSEFFLSPGLEIPVSVFASSFVLGEGLIFSKNSPTRAHSTLSRPPRSPLPVCVRARALPVFSAPPIARVCHFADISDFRADVRNIALPPTFAFPHPLWRRSDRHFPVHIGDSEITRTDPFSNLDSRPYPGACRRQGPLALARRLPCRLYALGPIVPLFLLSRYSCCCDLR